MRQLKVSEILTFDGDELVNAVRATFANRGTEIEFDPICFSTRFAEDAGKQIQWTAFCRRSLLAGALSAFAEVVGRVKTLLEPVAAAVKAGRPFRLRWTGDGTWELKP